MSVAKPVATNGALKIVGRQISGYDPAVGHQAI
jgi:hypothetical protein